MEWKYSCPKCTAILNPGSNIILVGRREGIESLLAFHPEPGNYELKVPHNVAINNGDSWEFFCPVCHADLKTTHEENLAVLDMTDGSGEWYRVLFSRIAGEHATFVIAAGPEIKVEKFGPDLAKYEHCLWHKYL